MNEIKIVFLWPHKQFAYWREGTPPQGAATMGYTLDGDNGVGRQWYLLPPDHHVEGFELPPEIPPHRLIDPQSIKLNEPTKDWAGIKHPPKPLKNKPVNLISRWEKYRQQHPKAVIVQPSYTQRIKKWWNKNATPDGQ